ncbi:hypothetical protein O181_127694 [Austropuccinia psidii MF-1]|uniref:Uncharacterized protein n=1 Tax=Austropuccinia psidii MF-1 TaxID=1389203 RepID=A0A9Q3KYI0_9BASI|nr:hypothetical protein [Austropuccinia psidii MF-1]
MDNWPYPSPVANMATSSSYGPFMAFHLNPEAIAAIYAQLGISGHFPQNQGEWPKWLFWPFELIMHICAFLSTLRQSLQKTLSRPLGQFSAQNPKVAKSPKGPRNTFQALKPSHPSFSPLSFHLKTFGPNLLSNEPICH